jgi:hypothetical protein
VKLGSIELDDCILDALRDDRLVIFAGAGISMGAPSNLSSFWKLTSDIARGTGLTPVKPLDRFLGQLHHRKVAVHERAAQLLSPPDSTPNALHQDLLRLFGTADRVRLVTTNFDLHFQTAATTLFGASPAVYRAPALPLGYDFDGIVHVHGALPRARDLVLTDADFGRAYLTEGWARRFLVDVFRRYTVLFVGYSHDDVVMNYLARALPAEGVAGRFALTEEAGSWDLLGIKPIRFNNAGSREFTELYEGVKRLADCATRGALDWRTRLSEMGGRAPPADEEAISEVEHALREVHTTRFLTDVARDPQWMRWLNSRKYLDALFSVGDLSERDQLLASWVAQHFAVDHASVVFGIVAAHGLQLNPALWLAIGREIGLTEGKPLQEPDLKRWVNILLTSAPALSDHHVLMWLAQRCASEGCVELALRVFLTMGAYRLSVKPGLTWPDDTGTDGERSLHPECALRANHWTLNEVWTKQVKPSLPRVAQLLLSGVAGQLEDMHQALMDWGSASRDWDTVSYGRSAIEPHEQDRYPDAVDVLIDAGRDALDSLGANEVLQGAWIERLVTSEVPLLRRLAVHAIAAHPGKSAEERLMWVLNRVGLHQACVHHEVHRAVATNYPVACYPVRKAIVDAVLTQTLQGTDNWSAEERTARSQFNWLSWLLQAKPDCSLAGPALAPIKALHPDWRMSEYPDLTHWVGSADWAGSESPWSVVQLLARAPVEQLDELLTFKGNLFDGPNREGLLATLREVCKQDPGWAFDLAQALSVRALWASDVWPAILRGLQESDLTVDGWRNLLREVAKPQLLSVHGYEVANVLYAIVRDSGKPFALDLLEQANSIALPLWRAMEPEPQEEDVDDWLSRAINRPAGVIVEFWINGLSLLLQGRSGVDRVLPAEYRQWFSMVVQDPTSKGGMARTLLASQTAFLFGLDESWTRQHVIALFSDTDLRKFAQAWDGFLVWGRLYPALVEALTPAFLAAAERLRGSIPIDRRKRFIKFYAALNAFHVSDPTQQFLPVFFRHGSLEDRVAFASHIGDFLEQMQATVKQQLWDGWLHRYWGDRLQGLLAPLDDAEIRKMLDWLPHLADAFPSAVSLALRFPVVRIADGHLMFEMCDSELVTRYPTETAELLIYLCNCVVGYEVPDLGRLADRLLAIPAELRLRVDEGLAHAGVLMPEISFVRDKSVRGPA